MKYFQAMLILFAYSNYFDLRAQDRKVLEASDLVNLKQVSDPQISPDGSLVAYVVTTPVPAGQHRNAHIWVVATDGRSDARPFALSSASDTMPRWSPDGKQLAFLSDRSNPVHDDPNFRFSIVGADDRKDLILRDNKESPITQENASPAQIWIISLAGGEAVPLTDIPGGIKAFKWSPDGKQLAFIRTDQDTKEEIERKKRKEDHIEVDSNYKFDRLWVYDLSSRQARVFTKRDANIDDFEWSPDGRLVLARVSPTPRIDDYWRVSKIEILNTDTGEVEKTLLEKAGPVPMHWSPDGRRVAVGRASSKNITSVPILIDVESGKQTAVAESYRATIGDMYWDLDGKALTASATEGTDLIFLRIDAQTGAATKVNGVRGPSGWFGKVSVSKDGKKETYLQETPKHPGEVVFRSGDHELLLTHTNPQTSNWRLGTEEKLSWKSSKDGLTIYGLVILPPDYQSGRRYKTIVFAHGGPEGAWESGFHSTWYDWGVLLASRGYVVLLPNPRGSIGLGTAFTEANYAGWGDSDFPDVMDGVDALIAKGITYVLAGTVEHGDSMGNRGAIGAGAVQWMTAGSGIVHQEMPKGDEAGRMHGFQLWGNLPSSLKMTAPRYQEVKGIDMPKLTDADGTHVRVVCGNFWGMKGPVDGVAADPIYLDVSLPAGRRKTLPVETTRHAFAYVFAGSGKFCNASEPLAVPTEPVGWLDTKPPSHAENRSLVLFDRGDEVEVEAGEDGIRFLLVSGKPLEEPVAWYGPIVMNTQEQLRQAFRELEEGTFLKV